MSLCPPSNTLIIGAGGVGAAVAFKCAQHNDVLGNLCVASRSFDKCERLVRAINDDGRKRNRDYDFGAAAVDARDVDATAKLIESTGSRVVINAADPVCNLAIMRACLRAGAHYLDTSVAEGENEQNMPAPWYANYEWRLKDSFAEKGLTALLSIGFDPGVVNVFAAYARKHWFDTIDTIDIVDINDGDHGRYFATNFNPEVNLREIMEEVQYWEEGGYRKVAHHSRYVDFDFPEIGRRRLYSVGHDELHSLPKHIPARRIEFWMGFGERYLRVFEVLNRLGLLSSHPVEVDGGVTLAPIKMVKAVLPNPADLAEGYTGKVCIGNWVRGVKDGQPRVVFIYSICSHEDCYADTRSQAVSYTTAVPAVTAALLLTENVWNPRRMVNVEELDPDPFLDRMPAVGIDWTWREEPPEREFVPRIE